MRHVLAALALLCATPASAEPLHDAGDAYALVQTDVSTLATMAARDAEEMDEALALALRHDPRRMAQGYLAYGALAAAHAPAFVAGVGSRVTAAGPGAGAAPTGRRHNLSTQTPARQRTSHRPHPRSKRR